MGQEGQGAPPPGPLPGAGGPWTPILVFPEEGGLVGAGNSGVARPLQRKPRMGCKGRRPLLGVQGARPLGLLAPESCEHTGAAAGRPGGGDAGTAAQRDAGAGEAVDGAVQCKEAFQHSGKQIEPAGLPGARIELQVDV